MLINKSQLTGFTLLVASFLFIPQVNADMRNEFNQQQNKQQKDNQERKELCSFVLANTQFKSENQHPVLHYYVIKPHIVEIEDVSDESNVGSKWSGKYCLIKKPLLTASFNVEYIVDLQPNLEGILLHNIS